MTVTFVFRSCREKGLLNSVLLLSYLQSANIKWD